MTSRGGGGAGRFRREHPLSSDGGSSKRGNNPPSRHLWVGNLSHSIVETDLTCHFLEFGELDSVAFQPGRSYAFINFKEEDEAIAAMKALQGFPVAGNPLRIEFAKADKSSVPLRDEGYLQRRDEQRSALRGSPFSQRDSRVRSASPDPFYSEKSKMSDRSTEPSEVLWIGFPAALKVDETILRKAFSQFGEIEKITVFPGRSYAFVRFRSVLSARRAKETLQGKLFGNPRVHICFAKSEAGSSNFKSNGRPGANENFRQDRESGSFSADPILRSPQFISDFEPVDSDAYGLNRKRPLFAGGSFDNWNFEEELGPPPDVFERQGSPSRFALKFPPKGGSFYEEPWDLPEDPYLFPGAKKLKTGSFPPEKELPDYPFSDLELEKRGLSRAFSDFPNREAIDNNFETGPLAYKPTAERPINPRGERTDIWKASYDTFRATSGSLPSNHVERKRFTPEPEQPSLKLWKWEGIIAKGGTPVCRARCFPVGKVLDIMLPEFLDCTARTGLDMLAKHYYQAASAWVVFFVAAGDDDMNYYNEFMHYLEEKQRAAVAKLDDKTTLFLVPPSDFSEKVLKVPGKLSISGVVLRMEHPSSTFGPPYHPDEKRDTNSLSFRGEMSYPKPSTPSGHFSSMASFSDLGKPGADPFFSGISATSAQPATFLDSAHVAGSVSDSYSENRLDYPPQQRNSMLGPNWSPHHSQNFVSGNRNLQSQSSHTAVDPVAQEHHLLMPRAVQESSSSRYAGGVSSNLTSGSSRFQESKSSAPLSGLQPQELAQLASSLLGQQRQSASTTGAYSGDDFRQLSTMNQSDNQLRTQQAHGPQNQFSSDIPTSQFGQFQHVQQQQQQQASNLPTAVPPPLPTELQPGVQGNPTMQVPSAQEEDADPQKRLQATLQLAAALLQQIQHGKGT